MGMSMTAKQGEMMDKIFALHGPDGTIGGICFVEGPRNHRDYGVPGRQAMCLPVWRILEKHPNGWRCRREGYIRIYPNGRVYMPPAIRELIRKGLKATNTETHGGNYG